MAKKPVKKAETKKGMRALGGTAAGAAAGSLLGPVGAAAGAIIGGLAGAMADDSKVKKLKSRVARAVKSSPKKKAATGRSPRKAKTTSRSR